jgi:lysosomal acid phosphatase
MSKLLLLAVLVAAVAVAVAAEEEEGKLRFVVALFRHGDRTPLEFYPTDPYKDPSQWTQGVGQLTNRGKHMQYELGKYLRQRYGSFLGEEYNENHIYVRSTDLDRTLASAQTNLAGLFPPRGNQIWNSDLLWQPIPVHTVPETQDSLLASAKCPRASELLAEVLASPELSETNGKYEWLYKYLTENTGENVTTPSKLNDVYDTLYVEQVHNKTLPEWTQKVYPEEMQFLNDFNFKTKTWTHELKRLRSGPLIANLVETFRKVETNTLDPKERKMFLYACHDTTLFNLMNSLDMFGGDIRPVPPPYASLVTVELREREGDGGFFLSMDYRNDTARDPYPLVMPACGESAHCPLDKFDSLTKELRPENWEAECKSQKAAA